jgi:predicted patatin/cPLA2 family phospholipase
MNALVLSGGSAKGAFTAGAVAYLVREKRMKFDKAFGTSTGSLVGGPALLGDWRYLRDVYVGVDDEDILENSLIGKIVSLIASGTVPIQASMAPLRRMLADYYITKGKLDKLNAEGKELVVASVNVKTGETTYVSSASVPGTISHDTFVDAIVASSVQPVFTQAVQTFAREANHPMRKHLFYDGGVREFLPFEEAVRRGAKTVWAISTHPLAVKQTAWGGNTAPDDVNLLKAAWWTLSTLLNEVERGDLFRALAYYRVGRARQQIEKIVVDQQLTAPTRRELLKAMDNVFERIPDMVEKMHVIHPVAPMDASLEFNPEVMQSYYSEGFHAAKNVVNTPGGPPNFTDDGGFVLKLGPKRKRV